MSVSHNYIIADHIRAACFIIADGVQPGGKQRGYVLRRLIRRALASSLALNINISTPDYFADLVDSVISIYSGVYNEIEASREVIIQLLHAESLKFLRAIEVGKKEWEKYLAKSTTTSPDELAEKIWDLYQTHGVPFEVSEQILEAKERPFNADLLNSLIEEHQKKSQESSSSQFKSGVGEENEKTTRLHTVTHILHEVLRELFGTDVHQMGSAITSEKARFDFTKDDSLTPEELEQVREKVQGIINKKLTMNKIETTEPEARKMGAIGLFGEKYGEKVTVYQLTDENGTVYSQEFCGGPHVSNTSEIGTFVLLKQKSVGKGLKRLTYDVV